MARHYNLARMTTATTGSGTITLGAAVSGWQSFTNAGIIDGDTVTYAIVEGTAREVGRGVYTASGTTLTRDTILRSTTGSAISLAGAAEVMLTIAAEDLISKSYKQQYYFPPGISSNSSGTSVAEMSSHGIGGTVGTGTSASGSGNFSFATLSGGLLAAPIAYGTSFSAWMYVEALATAAEEFHFHWGYTGADAFNGVSSVGIYFMYDRLNLGSNWFAVTRSASVSTSTDTGVAVAAGTMAHFEIEVVSGSKVRFFINDALVATNTTNIPPTTTQTRMGSVIKKVAGTTARRVSIVGAAIRRDL